MDFQYRVFDFSVFNEKIPSEEEDDDENSDEYGDSAASKPKTYQDQTAFIVQMFGVNEEGKTCSITVSDFKPFFYVMVNDRWTMATKENFLNDIKAKLGKYYASSITDCKIIQRKKLYGFDGGKEHKFVRLEFSSMNAFNKVKNYWYDNNRNLLPNGAYFQGTNTRLYEANIPPILRFFHIKEISPSGWISLPKRKTITYTSLASKKTSCDFEHTISYKDIVALNNKETRVPLKIMSFDIEASSSHGDFPVPIKSYKKLATNIVDYLDIHPNITPQDCLTLLPKMMLTAFQYETEMSLDIDIVYPIFRPTRETLMNMVTQWMQREVKEMTTREMDKFATIERLFADMSKETFMEGNVGGEEGGEEGGGEEIVVADYRRAKFQKSTFGKANNKSKTIIDILCDKTLDREEKLNETNTTLCAIFPRLEGDKVTFIGSTFMLFGNKDPHFNHCICLNTCDSVDNATIETYATEREVLLAWQQLVQRENPDIVIGYNIFGFDYQFMFHRAVENKCVEQFLKLSRNKDEICGTLDRDSNTYKIEETSIKIASGQHDLKFIKMNGRLQIDLYNFFRREENLTSYKLDYVAGHFIGDFVKQLKHLPETDETEIETSNMTGLLDGSYIHLEEISFSVDYYDDGAKFFVTSVDRAANKFTIRKQINPDMKKKVRWCLAKDDVTPKDIFQMTNGTSADRAIIAKYCIQDCNLVNYLFNKADIFTGFTEMAKICSVPINFLVMRGQGIKLTSYISKKCREKRTLMPVIEKGDMSEAYEGAIVLDPKADLYLDNPVACVDYASLYPSSMISENLSHDSKVWTMEYDLANNLIEEWGEKDADGNFIYDNLPGHEYVTVTYKTYQYVRNANKPTAKPKKVHVGRKVCRFVQSEAIMPSILKELLLARKTTRKLIPEEKDEFMKNVLDKRQLGYKVTANSLYGQCGAKTSTFYEKDIAACTTATGQLLLTYAKKIIEQCYGDLVCETENYGLVRSKAEYIYGDTGKFHSFFSNISTFLLTLQKTDSVFFTFNLQDLDGNPIRGKKALEITIELAQQAGHLASNFLKMPHDLEYEKTFMPFCLLSKKRYVGMLYETDPEKCKRKEMGIVLKRRDNAPIVKDVYGGIIDILMKHQNIDEAMKFLRSCLQNIVDEKYPMDKLIITKSLRSDYKNPQSIAHKVLADRITARDPGNKPGPGDRIPFVYVNIPGLKKDAKQGEKIETPAFILEHKLKIDYSFYITNQIMKPVQQVFALVLHKIWESQGKLIKIRKFKEEVEKLKRQYFDDEDKFEEKLEDLKNKEVKALLFDEYLRETNNEKQGNQSLTKLGFTVLKKNK